MKEITIIVSKNLAVKANYMRHLPELFDGLFKDMTKPLLMEIPLLLRGSPITMKDRKEQALPDTSIITFDADMKKVQSIANIPRNSSFRPTLREKFVLEIPMNLELPYEDIMAIDKLRFVT